MRVRRDHSTFNSRYYVAWTLRRGVQLFGRLSCLLIYGQLSAPFDSFRVRARSRNSRSRH